MDMRRDLALWQSTSTMHKTMAGPPEHPCLLDPQTPGGCDMTDVSERSASEMEGVSKR